MVVDSRSLENMTGVPLYSIVIPTMGNHDVLWQTLDYLHRTDLSQAEVIVVFNGRPQDREKVRNSLASRFPSVQWVSTAEPYGIARANNLGARAATGRFVAFLHDDVLIHEGGWLARLSELLTRRPDIGMVGGSEPKDIDRSATALGDIEPGVVECDWSPTISVARRSDLDTCAFDEFYLVGLEDKDWALAFRRKGLKVVCRKVAHTHVGTKGSYSLFLNDRRLLDYYSKEGVRERYFLTKNKDVLAASYLRAGWKKWGHRDRDWRKTWWMKLYVHSFIRWLLQKAPSALDATLIGLAFVLPLSIALSNALWGVSLLLWAAVLWTKRSRYRWTGLEWPYLVGLGIAVFATLMSDSVWHGLRALRSEILVVVFILAAQTGDSVSLRKRLYFFSLGALVAAGWGYLQWTLGFEWSSTLGIGSLPEKIQFLPTRLARLLSLHAGRAQGFYNHPITFAEMLLLSGAVILGSWKVERKLFWPLAGSAVVGAILLSQTRGVWMAMFFLLGLWTVVRKDKKILAVASGLVLLFALCLGFSPRLRGRAVSIMDTHQNESNLIRMGLWDKSLQLIREHPLTGIGSGNFLVKGSELRWGGSPSETKWTETHSIYLQNAVERGLLGFVVFLWFLVTVGRKLWQAARSAPINWGIFFGFIGLLMAGVTESWTNDSEIVMCVYFLVGTAWSLGKGSIPDSKVI